MRAPGVLATLAGIPIAWCALLAAGCEARTAKKGGLPVVVNTWAFTDATAAAWRVLEQDGGSAALDAVEQVGARPQAERCAAPPARGAARARRQRETKVRHRTRRRRPHTRRCRQPRRAAPPASACSATARWGLGAAPTRRGRPPWTP